MLRRRGRAAAGRLEWSYDHRMHRSGDLSELQMLAWRRFLRAHALVTRRLESDLLAEQRLPLASYDVLVQLVEAPQRRLRMSELAERVLLSRSGLTRLVDRLEREGLVRREACDSDARGLFTVLTVEGLVRLREASPVHLRGVADHAVGRLDEDEAAALAGLLGRMLADDPLAESADVTPAG
jgi:DNA-binding MarR family transcriptional regulator